MSAFRIIPIVLYNGEQAVKTINFKNPRNVGSVINLARLYEARGVDELIFLDIYASKEKREPNYKIISSFAKNLSIPFAVGGGIQNVAQAEMVLGLGADRIVIGNGSRNQAGVCKEISLAFGKQAVIGAIDYHDNDNVYVMCTDLMDFCGELILTSIDREGTMEGPDTMLFDRMCGIYGISIVQHGGVARPTSVLYIKDHFNAVGIGSMFQFTQYTPKEVKSLLSACGVEVRQ